MKKYRYLLFICPLTAILLFQTACNKEKSDPDVKAPNVLIFSRTKAFRHECIEPGTIALESYFKSHGVTSVHSEDSSMITDDNLKPFDAVIFFQTTGNILDSMQQIAFQKFIHSGKGFMGIHSAADTEYDWPWYVNLLGAQFASHPDIQSATLQKADTTHIACKHLPARWTRTDEWYNFKQPPSNVQVLLTIDESTYQGGTMGANHPMSWCHAYDGGKSFYTALVHTVESYQDTLFLEHLLKGVLWAAGK
ncbi:MAG TPA: ThuA domain-containing protein [Saprospiraceae bacterium]|nr:ThuA domain-containing protein [Saprospiraceae bacterium]